MNTILLLIIVLITLEYVLERVLYGLNARDFGKPLPAELAGIYDDEKYQKQQEYSKAKYKMGIVTATISLVVELVAFGFGLFGWLDGVLREALGGIGDNTILFTVLLSLLFFVIVAVVNEIIDIPSEYYSTFVIEERFGFNKSTKKLFWIDQLKGIVVAVIIASILISLVTWIFAEIPEWFWLLAWGVLALFQIFILMFYSNIIVPLFNKQTPLEEGELRSKIEAFAEKAGFKLNNIYVMDSSKRSTHANAYFTGLGSKKRIVLYDTLIKQLTPDEIVAVLAHEVGHYKKRHTMTMLIESLASTLVMFFILGWALSSPELSIALGGPAQPVFHLGLIAFAMLYSPISTILGIVTNISSRKHEYEADAFAASYGLANDLISALKKLSSESLSNLQPHKALVFVHFSHPTLLQRITSLKKCGISFIPNPKPLP
ncbi:MAG: M48 family metallopeptidase [Paludibacteraceae bacterium]|nr:M48 family metallopeptidase [Paludibacteraceae bacterium]